MPAIRKPINSLLESGLTLAHRHHRIDLASDCRAAFVSPGLRPGAATRPRPGAVPRSMRAGVLLRAPFSKATDPAGSVLVLVSGGSARVEAACSRPKLLMRPLKCRAQKSDYRA